MPLEGQVGKVFRGWRFRSIESYLLGTILVLLWFTVPRLLKYFDGTVGVVDQSIWLLVVLALLSFLMVVGMSWYMLSWSWKSLGLPEVRVMVLQFRDLELWVQLGFFFASFALLVLGGVGALSAVL